MASHRELIQDQFTKQAVPFSKAMKDEKALRLLVEFAGASSSDTVLDVAFGRGIVVCAFTSVVAHATGIDLTPAMIERARILQKEKGLPNVTWEVADINP
jgi:ubiquinone/menaquinone biosynthesis C-methylase UbiE